MYDVMENKNNILTKDVKLFMAGKLRLRRQLSLFDATIYGVGVILGAGIYALIGEAAGIAGNAVWLSFVLAALVSALTGLSYAELSSMFPKEAAEYVYNKKAFNRESIGFIIGWILLVANIVAISTVSLGFGRYFSALFGGNPVIPAVGLIFVLSLVNFYGIKESSRINILCTFIETAGLLLIILFGISYFGAVDYFAMPNGIPGIIGAAALIFFAYIGFENIANISEETKNAVKVVPRALIYSLIISTIIYILVAVSAISVLGHETLSSSHAPLTEVARQSFGASAGWLLGIIALFATGNTVLVLLIVVSRLMYGMADDGALPRLLSTIHSKRRTPWVSIALTSFIAMLATLPGNITVVASLTDVGIFLAFISVNIAVIVLRYSRPNLRRPFKYPVNIGRFPILALVGFILMYLTYLNT